MAKRKTEKEKKKQKEYVTGIFQANPKGFGFVTVEGVQEDIFIREENVNGAFHGDEVKVELRFQKKGKRREGKIVRILKHHVCYLVGYFQRNEKYGFVLPDNPHYTRDIFVQARNSLGAVTGHKVVVQLISYGDKGKSPEGKIVELIGHVDDPGTDILSIVKGYELPVSFSEQAEKQARSVAKEIEKEDYRGRQDFREWQMVTIDGEDAKDLDDAISLSKIKDGYRLGVHIADVTHYVREKTVLDREALARGNSVYLVDRVIPMLPRILSNGICSLNAGEERLALSCVIDFDEKGQVQAYQICESVIRVDLRMSYTDVTAFLEGQNFSARERYAPYGDMLKDMKTLSKLLRKGRKDRGAIDFEFSESKIILDEKGRPVEIRAYERNVATRMIEDFMLLANETVAKEYWDKEIPFLYRTHNRPDEEKIRQLRLFVNHFGYTLQQKEDKVSPKEIQALLGKVEDTPQEAMISRLALRSMKQAQYTVGETGHFGLAATHYCHFTSPIRRYPDLQIHRIIKEHLHGTMNEERVKYYEKRLPKVAVKCSEKERVAEEAERETVKLKKAEYMEERIGEVYEGVISGVTKWGLYVELLNTIEGLVHVMTMKGDHYVYHEERFELAGERTGKTYQLGEIVRVRVTGVDRISRTIDFELV